MNRINGVRQSEFNYNRSQHNQTTEQQKIINRAEGWKTFLEILNEKILERGNQNAINSQNI